jgi:hypothetical protein
MTARRHELDDALRALERADVLTRGALAHQLDITERGRRTLHHPDASSASRGRFG